MYHMSIMQQVPESMRSLLGVHVFHIRYYVHREIIGVHTYNLISLWACTLVKNLDGQKEMDHKTATENKTTDNPTPNRLCCQ